MAKPLNFRSNVYVPSVRETNSNEPIPLKGVTLNENSRRDTDNTTTNFTLRGRSGTFQEVRIEEEAPSPRLPWDAYKEDDRESEGSCLPANICSKGERVLRILSYGLIAIVLGCSIISSGIYLILFSQNSDDTAYVCNVIDGIRTKCRLKIFSHYHYVNQSCNWNNTQDGFLNATEPPLISTTEISNNSLNSYKPSNSPCLQEFQLCSDVKKIWSWGLFGAITISSILELLRAIFNSIRRGDLYRNIDENNDETELDKNLSKFLYFFFEIIHSILTLIACFVLLPSLPSPLVVVFCMNLSILPSLSVMIEDFVANMGIWKIIRNILGFIFQLALIITIPAYNLRGNKFLYLWPILALLLSVRYSLNFSNADRVLAIRRSIRQYKDSLLAVAVALSKVLLQFFFIMPITMYGGQSNTFLGIFQISSINCRVDELNSKEFDNLSQSIFGLWIILFIVQTVYYFLVRMAVKIHIPGILLLIVLSISNMLIGFTICILVSDPRNFIGDYIYWKTFNKDNTFLKIWITKSGILFFNILGCVSSVLIGLKTWNVTDIRIQKTAKLFLYPLFHSPFMEESIILNRKSNFDDDSFERSELYDVERSEPPKVFACGTLWHENREEMEQMLRSIFKIDIDLAAKKIASKSFNNLESRDVFDFEAYILFDDAFNEIPGKSGKFQANEYVKQFREAVDSAAKDTFGRKVKFPIEEFKTPYGGKLVYSLPGGHTISVHLKNKTLIKNMKRWSQVMYFSEIIYKIDRDVDKKNLSVEESKRRRCAQFESTYILTLDGDVDFEPKAVSLLVDCLKRDSEIGGACGRIHPLGSGPMLWYQKFEYAIGHWFQKASEHVFGSVLCSPGCFSVIRLSAITDKGVYKAYTKVSEKALDFVQHDQGEDRWLTTLIVQRGHKIEYCAAADAFTNAPETFSSFYKQRRRWVTSTFINQWDLISNWKRLRKINRSLSLPFLLYQLAMIGASVLGPGTVLLMLTGALESVFAGLGWMNSFLINCVPLLIYILVCLNMKQSFQEIIAALLSAFYALIMLVVLIGVIKQMASEGLCSPSALFFLMVAAFFTITAILHPREITNLPLGLMYYVAIPSAYLLLNIYALCNINDKKWGTRDDQASESSDQQQKPNVLRRGMEKISSIFESSEQETLLNNNEEVAKEGISGEEVREDVPGEEGEMNNDQFFGRNRVRTNSIISTLSMHEESELGEDEKMFWEKTVEFLAPNHDGRSADNLSKALSELRNKACMAFFMVNAMYVTVVLVLQVIKNDGQLTFSIPCWQRRIVGGIEIMEKIIIEPIGFTVLAFFGIILIIQFFGGLCHSMSNFIQIMGKIEIKVKESEILERGLKVIVSIQTSKRKKKKRKTLNFSNIRPLDQRRASIIEAGLQAKETDDEQDDLTLEVSFKKIFDKLCEPRDKPLETATDFEEIFQDQYKEIEFSQREADSLKKLLKLKKKKESTV